jgi:hypothetical protein
LIDERPYVWEFFTRVAVSGGGTTIAFGDPVPPGELVEVDACDAFHNGAVATDLAIGVFLSGQVVLFVSSATDPARPLAGVPVCLPRRSVVPPLWQLIVAANSLAAGETVTVRALLRRRYL